MTLAKPSLSPRHPQNIPLKKWPDGWLILSISSHTHASYMASTDQEKRDRKWPVTRDEKIQFLIDRGEIPAAGIEAPEEEGPKAA